MNQQPATIHQCDLCLRYFADGVLVGLSFGEQAEAAKNGRIAHGFVCDLSDCAAVVAGRLEHEKQDLRRWRPKLKRQRSEGKAECRKAFRHRGTEAQRGSARLPYPPDRDFDERATSNEQPATQLPEPRPLTQSVGEILAGGGSPLSQAEFVASGKADSANGRILKAQ